MIESSHAGGTRTCTNCGTANSVTARFCAECGTRLVSEDDLEQAFEAGVADVLGEGAEPTTMSAPPATDVAPTYDYSTPPELEGMDAVATAGESFEPADQSTWVDPGNQRKPLRQNTALWIVLGILAFILACCCGLSLIVAVSAANDTALQRELSLLAIH